MKQLSILKAIKSKPSIALQRMVEGLQEQSKRKNFEIVMTTFGSVNNNHKECYGCAATCAIQKIAKKNLLPLDISDRRCRAKFLKIDEDELDMFEYAMDNARRGSAGSLFMFCKKNIPKNLSFEFNLEDDTWKEQIPKVKETIVKLKKLGL